MAYTLIIMGWDANNRLYSDAAPTVDPADPAYAPNVGVLQANLATCRNCGKSRKIVVSSAAAGAYAAGGNDLPTDTKEIYVLQFADRAHGYSWIYTNRDKLLGKQVRSIDDTLSDTDPAP